MFQHTAARRRLGGLNRCLWQKQGFNTQPPEGGWRRGVKSLLKYIVSTHSRPKAAGPLRPLQQENTQVSTHSRPKAAGHQFG